MKEWKDAYMEEVISINKNKIWIRVDKPSHINVIGLKWVFKIKKDADGTINKINARLVVKEYLQEHVQGRVHGVEHIATSVQGADILTKALARIKFKEMRELIRVQDLSNESLKLKGENVGDKLRHH